MIAQLWRKALLARGPAAFDAALAKFGAWSITGLLATLLLFGFKSVAAWATPVGV